MPSLDFDALRRALADDPQYWTEFPNLNRADTVDLHHRFGTRLRLDHRHRIVLMYDPNKKMIPLLRLLEEDSSTLVRFWLSSLLDPAFTIWRQRIVDRAASTLLLDPSNGPIVAGTVKQRYDQPDLFHLTTTTSTAGSLTIHMEPKPAPTPILPVIQALAPLQKRLLPHRKTHESLCMFPAYVRATWPCSAHEQCAARYWASPNVLEAWALQTAQSIQAWLTP